MRSIVINLPSDNARLEAFQLAYPSSLLPELEIWKAKSGNEIDVPSWWKKSPNRYALTVNFIDILDSVDEDVWIWEDDCIFAKDFNTRFPKFMEEVPIDADMIFLGGTHFDLPKQVSKDVLKLKATWCGHAILYRKSCIKTFADYLREPNWGCSHYSDQRRAQAICTGLVTAYAPVDTLCGQAEGYSNLDFYNRNERWYNRYDYIDLEGQVKHHA